MSALSAIEAAVVDRPEPTTPGGRVQQPARAALRLVQQPETMQRSSTAPAGRDLAEPRSSSIPVAAATPGAAAVLTPTAIISPRPRAAAAPAKLRLTRRGRAVVATLVVGVVAAACLVIALAVAGGAQAASHGVPAVGHQGMHQVIVRSGQTLWSIASAAEPTADPRLVVQQIMAANRMSTADVTAGQSLWVPIPR